MLYIAENLKSLRKGKDLTQKDNFISSSRKVWYGAIHPSTNDSGFLAPFL